jgi:LEA14-like dessication related protein
MSVVLLIFYQNTTETSNGARSKPFYLLVLILQPFLFIWVHGGISVSGGVFFMSSRQITSLYLGQLKCQIKQMHNSYFRACFFFLLISITACSGPREPEFRKMVNIQVEEATLNNIQITAEAVYYNPNVIGITFDQSDVFVKANGFEVGKIEMTEPEKIYAKTEFAIPVEVNFPPSKIFERESGLLSSIISTYLDRKIDLEYYGSVTMEIGGIKFKIPVEYEETVDLKKEK